MKTMNTMTIIGMAMLLIFFLALVVAVKTTPGSIKAKGKAKVGQILEGEFEVEKKE